MKLLYQLTKVIHIFWAVLEVAQLYIRVIIIYGYVMALKGLGAINLKIYLYT